MGKPALSSTDIQELLNDWPDEEPTQEDLPEEKPKMKPEKHLEKSVIKKSAKEIPQMVRLPSSWMLSKSTPPSKRKTTSSPISQASLSSPPLCGQSLLKPFKIPKKSPSTNPDLQKNSPDAGAKAETVKLKTINIFQRIKEEKIRQQKQINKTFDWNNSMLIVNKFKRKPEDETKVLDDTENKILPQVDEKIPKVEIKNDAIDEPGPSPKLSVDKPNNASEEEKPSQSAEEVKAKEKEEIPLKDNIEQPATTAEKRSSNDDHESRKIRKEMKRLHENIVKDLVPLASRRSCTLKRSNVGYRDSPIITEGLSHEDKELPNPKRTKSDYESAPKKTRNSLPVNKTLETETVTKLVHAVAAKTSEPLDEPAPKKTRNSLSVNKASETLEKITPIRTTRRSAQVALEKSKETEQEEPKNLQTDPKSQVGLEKILKDFDLKTCAINLPAVSAEELKKIPKTQKQTARKSTGRPTQLSPGIKVHKALLNQKKIATRSKPAKISNIDFENDDEWEDIDEPPSNDESEESMSVADLTFSSKSSSTGPPTMGSYVYKTICNIAFTHCHSGAIYLYKCMINGCHFQNLDKHLFVKHLETRHREISWNGFCIECKKCVMQPTGGHSIMNEFIHMIEEHLNKDKVILKELPEVLITPLPLISPEHETQSSVKSPTPDSDLDLMAGIDAILEELLPKESDKKKSCKEKASERSVKKASIFQTSSFAQIPSLQATTIVTTQTVAPTPTPKAETKVIARNIVGRVITLPPGALQRAKRLIPCAVNDVLPKPQTIAVTNGNEMPPKSQPQTIAVTNEKPKAQMSLLLPRPVSSTVKNSPTSTQSSQIIPSAKLSSTEKNKKFVIHEADSSEDKLLKQKFIIRKPTNFRSRTPQPQSQPKPYQKTSFASIKETSSVQGPSDKPATSPSLQNQIFFSLSACPVSKNLVVTKEQPKRDPLCYQEILRPWLGVRTKKNLSSIQVLKTPLALTALFKCLAENCCFFTADFEIFHSHLLIHTKFTQKDKNNYMGCAYCKIDLSDHQPIDLVMHIQHEHCFDKFMCNYCFYRSCTDFNVLSHQNKFHKMKPRTILKIDSSAIRNQNEELELIKKSCVKNVPKIVCVCKSNQRKIYSEHYLNIILSQQFARWSFMFSRLSLITSRVTQLPQGQNAANAACAPQR